MIKNNTDKVTRFLFMAIFGFACYPSVTLASTNQFLCQGTEPFWDLTVSGKKSSFTIDDEPPVMIDFNKPYSAVGTSIDYHKIYDGASNGRPVVLIVQKQSCSDGMSDKAYEYQSILKMGKDAYLGCCVKK